MGYEKTQQFARCKLAGRVDFLGQQRIVLGKVIGAQILLWGTESFAHASLCPDCLLFGLVAEQDRLLRYEKNRGQQPFVSTAIIRTDRNRKRLNIAFCEFLAV